MKKISDLLRDKKFLAIFSLIAALAGWFVVATIISPTGDLPVSGVPVNINVQASVLGKMGLNAIEGGETAVEVMIRGKRSVIGGIKPEDITVTASLAGVSGAGTYKLELIAENTSDRNFEVLSISPGSMTVKFDRLVDKVIPVTYQINGDYVVPEGFLREDIIVEPAEITVTGPEKDIASIAKIVASVELSGTIEQTTSTPAVMTVLDKNDAEVVVNADQVLFSSNAVTVTMPLLKTKELAVRFEYLNVPEDFPIEDLKYELSSSSIVVAGPTDTVDKYNDIMVGYVDLQKISLATGSFVFDVKLPEGFVNTENTDIIQVDFKLDDFVEKEFYVNKFVRVNVPVLYTVDVIAQQIKVKVIGPKDYMATLTAKNIVAEVDISDREVATGQYIVPFDVYIPNAGMAWAVGTYSGAVVVGSR